MIKRWSTFNESASSDNFRDEVNKIRQYFLEYEDDNIVSYQMYAFTRTFTYGRRENEMLWSVNPNTGNFDRWVDSQTEEANRYDAKDLDNYPFIFTATVKIQSAYSELDDFGVDKLKDVLTTFDRLKDSYDKVLIDMNSQNQDYKPVRLKIYFNPIVD